MRLSDFDYFLPKNLIAQKPASPRDKSRLMVLDGEKEEISHSTFFEIGKFLKKGDVLVFNDSKVIPARIFGQKETGGRVEIFLLNPETKNGRFGWPDTWNVLTRPGLKKGQKIFFKNSRLSSGNSSGKNRENNIWGEIISQDEYKRKIKFNIKKDDLKKFIFQFGQIPLPPYIKEKILSEKDLKKKYQTVFAKNFGSAAAPTAGFHFTNRLLEKLKRKGVKTEFITLHVGLGTFQPVFEENIANHKMHEEWAEISCSTSQKLNNYKKQGRRIIAVGTTSARCLESFSGKKGEIKSGFKKTGLFIYPGYKFKFIDGLITNFHLPHSTLLMLTSALAGRDFILRAYKEAVDKKYRFYSFGDGMIIF